MAQHWKLPTLVLAIGLGWVVDSAKANEVVAEETISLVKTFVVEESQTVMERRFLGVIAAEDTVTLSFEVGGRLVELNAEEGAVIARGAPIAALNLAPFERDVRRAEISLEQARREFERARKLSESNVRSQASSEDAQSFMELAEVALEVAVDNLEDAQMLAPFDALISDRIASPFTTIEPGMPIVRLHDVSAMHVEFDVPERLVQVVAISDIEFYVELPGRTERIPAVLREFRPDASEVGQAYRVSVTLPADVSGLVPGATASVFAQVQMEPFVPKAPLLPMTAVTVGPDRSASVMVLEEEGSELVVRRTPVRVVTYTGSSFEVSGLPRGTEIVAIGPHLLDDGQRVARFEGLLIGEDQ